MNSEGLRKLSIVVTAMAIIAVVLIGTAGSGTAQQPAPQFEYLAAEAVGLKPVYLYYDPNPTGVYVPPPPQFYMMRARSATITINYLPAGAMMNSETCYTWPAEAITAFEYAASIWESLINSAVEIKVDACWTEFADPFVLGYGGSYGITRNFTNAPRLDTWYPGALANALAGTDLNGATAEIFVAYSRTFNWYHGTDGNTPGDKLDFASVVLHELCHGLGFAGSMIVGELGGSTVGAWGYGSYPTAYPSIYEHFVENGSGQAILSFANFSTNLYNQLIGNNLYLNAPNVTAAHGGVRPKIFAPSTWMQGSSYSHLDEIFNGGMNALMTFSIGNGETEHAPGAIALGLFKDIGWTITEVTLAPTVSSITPNTGVNTGSVAVSIAGSNFQSGATVRLTRSGQADIAATGVTVNATTITGNFNLSGVATGAWNVVVTNPDTQNGVLSNGFTVTAPPAPTVSSITPNSASNSGSVAVSIAGSNFQSGATVRLTRSGQADIAATGVTVNATTITGNFNLSGVATGAWNVVVTNPDTQSGTLSNGFTVTFAGKTWTGAVSNDWLTDGNWSPAGAPSITDDVLIPVTSRDPVLTTTDVAIKSLTIDSGAMLDLTAYKVTVEGAVTNNGSLRQTVNVEVGAVTPFLRFTNLVGNQTKYYGVDVTLFLDLPERESEFAVTAGAIFTNVTATISGNQFCADRQRGVKRCFEVAPRGPWEATVRFYFTEAERNGYAPEALRVFHDADGAWAAAAITPTWGSSGGMYYVEAAGLSTPARFALAGEDYTVYLPFIARRWPPVPDTPTLNVINNPSGISSYVVSWNSAYLAESYFLQEATDAAFSNPVMRYTGPNTSWSASGKSPGTYYYRVWASRWWEGRYLYSNWSAVRSVTVSSPPAGLWVGASVEFYVTPDLAAVDDFAAYISVTGCGNYKVTRTTPTPLSNNQFAFSGAYYASGTLHTHTTASGHVGFDHYYLDGCGYIQGSFDWTADWFNSSQPSLLVTEVTPLVVDVVTGPVAFEAMLIE